MSESQSKGFFILWSIISGKMMKINVRIPRVIYVNDREEKGNGVLVKRILPRLKPAFNLRRYNVDEGVFESSLK